MKQRSSLHDPIKEDLTLLLEKIIKKAFPESSVTSSMLFQFLSRPPEAKMGDYALPCFALAKSLRKNPSEIATIIKQNFVKEEAQWVERTEVQSAFLNFFLSSAKLAEFLLPKACDQSLFKVFSKHPKNSSTKVMIEFSQPNTHKEFHVGHGRNVCLGDSLCRIYKYLGYQVLPVNYIGDEGSHVAKCLWQLAQEKETQDESVSKAEWYGKMYVKANERLSDKNISDEERKTYQAQVGEILSSLEAKKSSYYKLWQKTRQDCVNDFTKIYDWLDVHFDHIFFESDVSEESQEIVAEYIKKGLFKKSDGAIGIPMEKWDLGFMMVRKSDGTSLYITKDLALARRKFEDFKIDKSIYVVGAEQNFHFKQLFKALEMMGFKQAKDCEHLSYAHVKLPEGKISSRKGNAIPFSLLQKTLLKEFEPYLDKYQDTWTTEELKETAKKLALGSIRYGMLQADPQKQITFDVKTWTNFEGHTGPYLMYSYSRTRSILRKKDEASAQQKKEEPSYDKLIHPREKELLLQIYDFNEIVKQACLTHKPSSLSQYLYKLCKSFNRFYAEISVLHTEDAALKEARFKLVEALSKTIKEGLLLLGITPPEKM